MTKHAERVFASPAAPASVGVVARVGYGQRMGLFRKRRSEPVRVPITIEAVGMDVVLNRAPETTSEVNIEGERWIVIVGTEYNKPASTNAARRMGNSVMVAQLKREPRNRYDKNAIAVMFDGKRIGYLSAHWCPRLLPIVKATEASTGGPVCCSIKVSEGGETMHVWLPEVR